MRRNVIAIQLQQFRFVFGKKIGDNNRGSVPFALSSNSALISSTLTLGYYRRYKMILKKKHTIVMQDETQRLSGPF